MYMLQYVDISSLAYLILLVLSSLILSLFTSFVSLSLVCLFPPLFDVVSSLLILYL